MRSLEEEWSFIIHKNFASVDHLTPVSDWFNAEIDRKLFLLHLKTPRYGWPSDLEHANQSDGRDHINFLKVVKNDEALVVSFICPINSPSSICMPFHLQLQIFPVSGLHT